MVWQFFMFDLANNMSSSAKYRWEIFVLSQLIEMMVYLRMSTSWLILLERSTMQRMKMSGDMRSSCLIPLMGLKKGVFFLLISADIEEVELDMQDIMSLIRVGGKLKSTRAFFMKDHSILPKSFSKSILRIILDCLPFILEK